MSNNTLLANPVLSRLMTIMGRFIKAAVAITPRPGGPGVLTCAFEVANPCPPFISGRRHQGEKSNKYLEKTIFSLDDPNHAAQAGLLPRSPKRPVAQVSSPVHFTQVWRIDGCIGNMKVKLC